MSLNCSQFVGASITVSALSATQHNPTMSLVDISFHCHEI
jgi:hypothetical protein